MRQLRHLPDAAGVLGRHGRRAEAAVHGAAAAAGAPPEVRRRAGHRHPARQEDRQGDPVRPRRADRVRHRHRAARGASGAAWSASCWPRGCSPSRATTARWCSPTPAPRCCGRRARGDACAASPSGAASARSGPRRKAGAPSPRPTCRPRPRAVFERLRAWRAATAKEQGVPAYVIFHDATLREIATPRAVDAGRARHGQRRRREQARQVRPAGPRHAGGRTMIAIRALQRP